MQYSSIYDSEYRLNDYNVNIFIGMRGLGKTFSALSPLYESDRKSDQKFLLARLTKDETTLLTSQTGNVFKDINLKKPDKEPLACFRDQGGLFSVHKYTENDDEEWTPYGPILSYVASMPTLRKSNGAGFSDICQFIVDEFIPPSITYRGNKFRDIMYCWETINRNREDDGKEPCKLILLSNANDIYDDVIVGFNLVRQAEKMADEGQQHYFDDKRSIALHIMKPSESFAEFKKQTAVARALQGTDFFAASYENKFALNDFTGIQEIIVNGWRPFASINNKAYLYERDGRVHVTYRRAEVPDYNIKAPLIKRAFKADMGFLETYLVRGKITWQSYELKHVFLDAIS